MPKKLKFHVIHVSGEDEQHRASELNFHSPMTKGWQSARFCMYPQTVVLQIQNRSRLSKIQLLAHQFLIPTKAEIFVGEVPGNMTVAMMNAHWTRLGYVTLSSNERIQFRARELKSCHVDANGHFVKFLLHKNHVNKYNLYNQVGIVAVNVIGDELTAWHDGSVPNMQDEILRENPALAGALRTSDMLNPLDDLAFDMYQDSEVAAIIRRLDMKKQQAIMEERYDFAKKIKDIIVEMQQVGEKLGKMDVEKRQAVALEDFDKAHLVKLKADEYRLQMYKELHVNDLLDVAGAFQLSSRDDNDLDPRFGSPRLRLLGSPSDSPPPEDGPAIRRRGQPRGGAMGGHHGASGPSGQPENSYQRYDDRPIPTLAAKQQQQGPSKPSGPGGGIPPAIPEEDGMSDDQDGGGAPSRTDGNVEEGGELEALDEKDMREAGPVIDVFGLQSVTKAFSKTWSFRENAILAVFKQMTELDSAEDAKAMFHAAVYLVKRAIADPVYAVFRAGLTLLKEMLSQFCMRFKPAIPKSEVQYCLEKVVPALLQRLCDTSQRVRDGSKNFILEMSEYPEVHPLSFVPPECLKPFKANTAPRVASLRMELGEDLFQKFHLTSGITVEIMAIFCMSALEHPSGEVQEQAIKLMAKLQRDSRNSYEFKTQVRLDERKPNHRKLAEVLEAGTTTLGDPGSPIQGERPYDRGGKFGGAGEPPGAAARRGAQLKAKAKQKAGGKDKDQENNDEDRASVILSNMCIFCLDKSDAFDERGLNVHYFTACPMLKKCDHCNQVIEISGLFNHWLSDCTAKELYAKCATCGDVVLKTDIDLPKHKRACRAPAEGMERCPLCLSEVESSDSAWREHLMGAKGCPGNTRRVTGPAARARMQQAQSSRIQNQPAPTKRK